MTTAFPVEHRWELGGGLGCWTAKHVEEIPSERAKRLSDTMAPVEELGPSVLGCMVPWTLSAVTRRGRERQMQRHERRRGFVGERVEV